MQTINSSSVQYAPAPIPSDQDGLRVYLETELRNIQTAISALASGHIDKSYTAPLKLMDGDFRWADGTSWNPGSGAGLYIYSGGSWLPFSGAGKVIVVNNNTVAAYTLPNNAGYIGFTGTQVATIAFTFPAAAAVIDGMTVRIFTQAAVATSSTWASSGATFIGAPATLVALSVTGFIYNHAALKWIKT